MEGYIICILVTAVITWLVAYVMGFDSGYAKGRRDEAIEHARAMRDMQRAEWRREAARKRMEEAKNGEKHGTAAGD